jgi:hypothetical protein
VQLRAQPRVSADTNLGLAAARRHGLAGPPGSADAGGEAPAAERQGVNRPIKKGEAMTSLGTGSALYYPTIEITNEMWLKNALCVWDNIYRIVPSGYDLADTDEIKRAVDADLLRSVTLSAEDLHEAADAFESLLDSVPVTPAGLQGHDDDTIRLFEEKVDARILPRLRELAASFDRQGRLHLPRPVADGYMLFLAESVSRRRGMPKATDDSDVYALTHYYMNDGNMSEYLCNAAAEEFTANLVIPTILPAGIEFSPMENLIRLHKDHAEGRAAFRDCVSTFIDQASKIEDNEHRSEAVQDFGERLNFAHRQRERVWKTAFQDIKYSLLCVGLPVSMTAAGLFAAGGSPFQAGPLAGGAAAGAVAALADMGTARQRRQAWSSQQCAYYLQLDKVARTSAGVRYRTVAVDQILEEFIND